MKIKSFDRFLAEGAILGQPMKDDYKEILTRFARVSKEYKVKMEPISSFMDAISDAENIAGIEHDGLYKITSAKKIASILDKVKKSSHAQKDLMERAIKGYVARLKTRHLLQK